MQRLIYIETNSTYEINNYLSDGWRVVCMTPAVYGNSTYNCGAYVVIEKDGDNKNA